MTSENGEESKAQREARLRRERRNAKIQAQGSERLSKITSLSGRPAAAEAELRTSSPNRPPPEPSDTNVQARPATVEDPEEVDISREFSGSGQDADLQQQAALLRQMLRGEDGSGAGGPDSGAGAGDPLGNDPMMRMMQQMLQGAGGPNASGGSPGDPFAGLASLMNAENEEVGADIAKGDYIWRIIHFVVSLCLGLYATMALSFTDFSAPRSRTARTENASSGPQLFLLFATVELVLQTTRYFLDRGKLPRNGTVATIAQYLPEPWGGYLRLASRYATICTTLVSDALIVVFVLGAVAWWNDLIWT